MNNEKPDLSPFTEEEFKEIIKGILQENRDNMKRPTMPRRIKCNDCTHRIPGTAKCRLLYPNGIPSTVTHSKKTCEEFKQK